MIQYIESKEVKSDLIERIKKALQIKTNKEFSEKFNIHRSSLTSWLKNGEEIPKGVQLALFYINQTIELSKQVEQLQEQLQNSSRADNQTDISELKKDIDKRFEKIQSQIKKIDARPNNENNDLNSKDQYKIILDTLQKENDKRLQKLTKDISTDILSTIKKELLKDDIKLSTETLTNFNDIQTKVNTLLKSPIIQGLIKDYE